MLSGQEVALKISWSNDSFDPPVELEIKDWIRDYVEAHAFDRRGQLVHWQAPTPNVSAEFLTLRIKKKSTPLR